MKITNFIQLIIAFLLFLGSIIIFKLLDLDVNFIITFILAIFSLAISIFFFTETNKFFGLMKTQLTTIQERVTNLNPNKEITKLKISPTMKHLSISDAYKKYNRRN